MQEKNNMLMRTILLVCSVALHAETAHLPLQPRHRRDVPDTSYGGYSPGGAGGPHFENQPNQGDGSYSYSYTNDNGITFQENGFLKENVPEGPGTSVGGYFVFTSPEGQQITTYYGADENGFVPQGAHLPTAPPVPPEILQALEKNAADEAAGIFDDGRYHGDIGSGDNTASGNRGFGGAQKGPFGFKG